MKRHEILNRELSQTVEYVKASQLKKWNKLLKHVKEKPEKADYRFQQIEWAIRQAAFDHLGYGPTASLKSDLENAMDNANSFFTGTWWQANEYDRLMLDKKAEYPVQGWGMPATYGLILAHWTDRWEERLNVLDWIDEDVARGTQHEDTYIYLMLYVVSLLHRRLSIHEGLTELIKRKCTKYERLLAASFEAIEEGDNEKFETSLKKGIKQFHKSEAEDVPNFLYWISVELSLVWAFASRQGISLPELGPQGDAVIIRPESIVGPTTTEFSEAPSFAKEELDSGLIAAIAELDYDSFAALQEQGASPYVTRIWGKRFVWNRQREKAFAILRERSGHCAQRHVRWTGGCK